VSSSLDITLNPKRSFQILIHDGVELEDSNKTLHDYQIADGAQLVLRTKDTGDEDLEGKSKVGSRVRG